jgi:hypothetical protein
LGVFFGATSGIAGSQGQAHNGQQRCFERTPGTSAVTPKADNRLHRNT